ncbi:DUF2787 domain-containing protein [Vibrio cholerae]|nr:DUF2787 domain-containing protein [Vibrio cholerae]
MLTLKQDLPFTVPSELIAYLTEHVKQDGLTTINFKDMKYHPKTGGFCPVKIMVDKKGNNVAIVYYTDFRYYGQDDYAELSRSNDFNFQEMVFFTEHLGYLRIDASLANTFHLLVKNALCYVDIGCLDVVEFQHTSGHILL